MVWELYFLKCPPSWPLVCCSGRSVLQAAWVSLPSQALSCPQHAHLPLHVSPGLFSCLRCFSRPPSEALSLASWVTGSPDLAGQVQGTEFREHHVVQGKEGKLRQVFPDLGSREGQTDGSITESGGYRVEVGCVTLKSSCLGVNPGSLLIGCRTLGGSRGWLPNE